MAKIFLSVLAALFSLGLAEGGLRLFWLPAQSTPMRLACEYDPQLGWRKIPGASVRIKKAEFEVRETINSRGMRGPHYPYEPAASTIRVLLLGDSFVEGYSVDEPDLFSILLEKKLNSPERPKAEVINMGTGGYSTDQEYLAYLAEGRRYAPDLVILFFYHNDLLYNLQPSYYTYPKPYFLDNGEGPVLRNVPVPRTGKLSGAGAFLRSLALVQLLQQARYRLFPAPRGAASSGENELDCFRKDPPPWVDRAWQASEWLLRELKGAVERDGGKLAVIYIPAPFEVEPQKSSRPPIVPLTSLDLSAVGNRIRDVCRRNRIDFLDLRAGFAKEAALGPFYYPADGHWNPRGHHRVSEILSRAVPAWLKER
jgi:hypothetical protein